MSEQQPKQPRYPEFARALSLKMAQARWGCREIAVMLDYHESTVSRWRSGERRPSAKALTRLCQILDCQPEELWSE